MKVKMNYPEQWDKYMPPALVSLVFLITYVFLYKAAIPLFAEPDVPWHIAAGDLVRATGHLPKTDTWSFTAQGHPWFLISWLWDITLSFIVSLWGLKGVFVFTIGLTSLIAALLAYELGKREGVGSDALIMTMFLAGLSFWEFATARPHLAGYLFILIFQQILHKSRTDDSLKKLLVLPFLMILWVNIHGSFIVAFTLLGAYGLEAMLKKRVHWLKDLLITSFCCLVACLVNPYGIGIIDAVMSTLGTQAAPFISEWKTFAFGQSIGLSAWFLLFLVTSILRRPGLLIADEIISVMWMFLMLMSIRNGGIFILVSAPNMARSMEQVRTRLEHIRTEREDIMKSLARHGMQPSMLLLAVMVIPISFYLMDSLKGDKFRVNPKQDPGKAITFLVKNAQGKRVLNDYDFGGRIAYMTGGHLPIFIDGRAGTAYPETVVGDYLKFLTFTPDWKPMVEKYKIDAIIIANTHHFPKAFEAGEYHDEWKQVYTDAYASVYFKK